MMTIGAVPVDADAISPELADHLSSLPGSRGSRRVLAEDVVWRAASRRSSSSPRACPRGTPCRSRVYQLVARFGDHEVIAVGRASAERFDAIVAAFRAVGRSMG